MNEIIIFWAMLTHQEVGKPVPYSSVSPSFGTQPELVTWIRVNRREDDEVAAWKRTTRGADFHDERLSTREEPDADPARLKAMFADLSARLAAVPDKPVKPTAAERDAAESLKDPA